MAESPGQQLRSSAVYLVEIPRSFLLTLAAMLGLLFGSFLNVVIHRLPRDENIAFPPSTCPACQARIRPYDNLPVLGWLMLRGKARCCGARISPRYPIVELIGGLAGCAVMQWLVLPLPHGTFWYEGLLLFGAYFALILGLIALMFIDLEHMLLPDELTYGGAIVGLISLPLRDLTLTDSLLGGLVGFLIVWLPFDRGYRLLRGHAGMGLGDAKLCLLAGVWFGWPGAVFALLAGAVQGTIFALAVLLTQGKIEEPEAVQKERAEYERLMAEGSDEDRERLAAEYEGDFIADEPGEGLGQARIPFGPFLIFAILEYLFFHEAIKQFFLEHFWLA